MFGKIKGALRAFFKEQRFFSARYILKYVLLWLVLCLVITDLYGGMYYEDKKETRVSYVTQEMQRIFSAVRETAKKQSMMTDENELLAMFTIQKMDAYAASLSEGTVRAGSVYYTPLSNLYTHEDNNVYLVIREEENTYLSCPKEYLKEVWDATIGTRKNVDSAWLEENFRTGWIIELIDGYRSGTEFRPGKVHAVYYEHGYAAEEKTINCSPVVGDGFIYTENLPENELYFPKDVDNWTTESHDDQIMEMYPIYGHKEVIYPLYFNPRWGLNDCEVPVASHAYLLSKKIVVFRVALELPFSYRSGDVAYAYRELITDVNGKESEVVVNFYATGMVAECFREVLVIMLFWYIVLGIIIGVYARRQYNRMFSLSAASRFHKTLISSMAHDLKTPLMIMQGFGENLAENVHTEKREYYAEQILDNIKYLNGLIDKNLDFAKKDDLSLSRSGVYIMRLAEEAEKRYEEMLQQKNLTIVNSGAALIHGDRALLQTVVDNLIVNAIKYSPEGGEICVYARKSCFIVRNKASLSYAKNINKLLEPLEMGDESRTSGKGTGLGLSIANTIVEQHGWTMKLSYNRKKQEFTCAIRFPWWRRR